MSRMVGCVVGLAMALPALGNLYWIAWEGVGETATLPEQCGWLRNWGNWEGHFKGPGATRTIENGILTYDSLYDPGVCDFSFMERPGQMDPGPGELFVMEWRLKVDEVTEWYYDPGVCVVSDAIRGVGLGFNEQEVISVYEGYETMAVDPNYPHDYRLLSADMLTYTLFIDGQLARAGNFMPHVTASYIGWGDGVQGAASLHHWDYFRFGVLPAPQAGDVNCDGTVDFADINPFVQVLTDGPAYQDTYPACWPENADINGDGSVDFGDINPFVELLIP